MPLSPSTGPLLYSVMSSVLRWVPMWLTVSGRDDLVLRKRMTESGDQHRPRRTSQNWAWCTAMNTALFSKGHTCRQPEICDSDMGMAPPEQPAHLEMGFRAAWPCPYLISRTSLLESSPGRAGLICPSNSRGLCRFLGLSWQKGECPSFVIALEMLLFCRPHCTYILQPWESLGVL